MDLSWGAVCLRRVPTSWAGVRGPAWALRAEANTQQMTFIAEYVLDVGADRGVLSPGAPLASHASPSPGRFERLEGFTANEGASPHGSEEQKQVCGQMAEFPVACFIELPTAADFLCVESSPGIILPKPGCCRVQFVDLPARACLVPIEATRVHEQRARHLHRLVGFRRIPAHHYGSEKTMNSPIEPKHAFCRFPLGQLCCLHLHDDIEDSNAAAIGFDQFAQRGSHWNAFREASHHALGEGDLDCLSAPLPRARVMGESGTAGTLSSPQDPGKGDTPALSLPHRPPRRSAARP
jgi:hypothetical protein